MSTSTTFDLQRFTRAAQERDAATQLGMYHPDATVTIADKISTPSTPRVLSGTDEIQAFLEDTFARDMTHTVQHTVHDAGGAAYTVACRYPDGTRVLCATVVEFDGGLIARQTIVQAWDEPA